MSRRYDTRTTIFSPQGRLFQVEYAMQAINHAGTCVGIVFRDGVILGSEKRNIDKLLDSILPEKIYKVSDNIICSVAGVTSDATTLINQMRIMSERHFYKFQEGITVEQLVTSICNTKQQYTQVGGHLSVLISGYRPFGVSLLYAGWDCQEGFQLFQSDPSGNYSGWKSTCIGKNHEEGVSLLKTDYIDNMDFNQVTKLLANVLNKTVDKKPMSSENIEVGYITLENQQVKYHLMNSQEIDEILKTVTPSTPSQIHP
ncbi:hypothetical protein HZS_7963 [Henneguya salminicola]|nr:hypothetical protein HZS_7963 [Henneguya salminicola]